MGTGTGGAACWLATSRRRLCLGLGLPHGTWGGFLLQDGGCLPRGPWRGLRQPLREQENRRLPKEKTKTVGLLAAVLPLGGSLSGSLWWRRQAGTGGAACWLATTHRLGFWAGILWRAGWRCGKMGSRLAWLGFRASGLWGFGAGLRGGAARSSCGAEPLGGPSGHIVALFHWLLDWPGR